MDLKWNVCQALLMLLGTVVCQEGPKVKTTLGWVQGGNTKTRGGRDILEFLGIPYALPPVDNLRYKSPVPMTPWDGVRDATKECDYCIQEFVLVESLRNTVTGSEDCLCINIYTPSVTSAKKLPVIFWIHGGAHMGMSPQKIFYGPDFILDKDVVLVTFSYRVGVLGFLTTGDDTIPGNFGMKDQALALRWVRDNIAQFGGDVNSITLAGESSGAGSVFLHMVSPVSKNLFHRAVLESGSGLCPWGYSEPQFLKKQASKVARLLGCPFTPSTDFLKCLQSTPPEKIVGTTNKFLVWDNDPVAFWNPTLEPTTVKDAFLTESPWKLKPNPIPLLAGVTFAEGGFKTYSVLSGDVKEKFKVWNKLFKSIEPISLLYANTAPNPWAVTDSIRHRFFGPDNVPITPDMIPQITELYGDAWFINGVLDTVERHPGPKYLYYLNYNTTVSNAQRIFNSSMYIGAVHMDELLYLFPMNGGSPVLKADPNNPDYKLSTTMVDLWTNFAYSSNPSTTDVKWTAVKSADLEYLDITREGLKMKTELLKERRKFWKTLKLRRDDCDKH